MRFHVSSFWSTVRHLSVAFLPSNCLPGVDEKEVGAPEKLPEHTFEVGHSRRRSYLITAENEQDKMSWVEAFKVCCRKAYGKIKKSTLNL